MQPFAVWAHPLIAPDAAVKPKHSENSRTLSYRFSEASNGTDSMV